MFTTQVTITVTDASQVGEARRQIRRLALDAKFKESDREAAALIATELATNLARHSKDGELHIRSVANATSRWLEITSVDRGPGMSNVSRCLEDGFSTGGTPGNGLGATRRLSTEFDIHSCQPAGTVVFSRVQAAPVQKFSRPRFSWAGFSRPAPGEMQCGDAWSIAEQDHQLAVTVIDGLGHGPQAAEAAGEAASAFDEDPFAPLTTILQRADLRMRGTRGGAVAMAHIDGQARLIKYVGVGNIAGHLRADSEEKGRGLFSHNGTIGVQVRKIQEFEYPCPSEGLLIMHSDGLQSRWSLDSYPGLARQHPGVIAAILCRDYSRGRDDVTVAVVRMSLSEGK